MSENAPEPQRRTVADQADQCLVSFRQCLLLAAKVHPLEYSLVEDQLARFSTWTVNTGAFAPCRASMDHRLRCAPEVRNIVMGLLETLDYRIRSCSKILDTISQVSQKDNLATTDDRLSEVLREVASEISRLNRLSNVIRRAGKETQNLKANEFSLKDEDGYDTAALLFSHFQHHIRDRFPTIMDTIQDRLARAMVLRRKRILYKRSRQPKNPLKKERVAPRVPITFPEAQEATDSKKSLLEVDNAAAVTLLKVVESQTKSATTLAPEKFQMANSTPSLVSTSKTISLNDHEALNFPPSPGVGLRKKYERMKEHRWAAYEARLRAIPGYPMKKECSITKTETTRKVFDQKEEVLILRAKLEEALKDDLHAIGEVTCPYCLDALPASDVFDALKWQTHVKSDLDPYICLFENCDQPDRIYGHYEEWLQHMQEHTRLWRCSSHRQEPFSAQEDYLVHMRKVHNTKLNDTKLRVLANRSARKQGKIFDSCPLCGEDNLEARLLDDHIVGHLRSLALKSLPSYEDRLPEDLRSENNSTISSNGRVRSTIKDYTASEGSGEGSETDWDYSSTDGAQSYMPPDEETQSTETGTTSHPIDWNFITETSRSAVNLADDSLIQRMLESKKPKARMMTIGSMADPESSAPPTSLLVEEQISVLGLVNDRLQQCAYEFFTKHHIPIPLTECMGPVKGPRDREWTEWVYLLRRLAAKRRTPTSPFRKEQIEGLLPILEDSLDIHNAAQSQTPPGHNDRTILQLITVGFEVAKILQDAPAMEYLKELKLSTKKRTEERSGPSAPTEQSNQPSSPSDTAARIPVPTQQNSSPANSLRPAVHVSKASPVSYNGGRYQDCGLGHQTGRGGNKYSHTLMYTCHLCSYDWVYSTTPSCLYCHHVPCSRCFTYYVSSGG